MRFQSVLLGKKDLWPTRGLKGIKFNRGPVVDFSLTTRNFSP